jgi:hypothetical protein
MANDPINELSAKALRRAATLREKIDRLQGDLKKLLGGSNVAPAAGRKTRKTRKRSKMSAAARARIGAATRARWARYRAEKAKKAKK